MEETGFSGNPPALRRKHLFAFDGITFNRAKILQVIDVGADGLEEECEYDEEETEEVCYFEQEIPDDYLESLPDNTLVKAEIGAISSTDNATFSEEGDWCVNDTFPEGGIYDEDEDAFLNGCGEPVDDD